MKDKFYAVVFDDGIVTIKGDGTYAEHMAVFGTKDDAQKVLDRNPEAPLKIVEVAVFDY